MLGRSLRRFLLGLLGALLAVPAIAATPGAPTRQAFAIGVLAPRPKPQVLAGWMPLAAALERALPDCQFTVEVFDYPELEAAVAAHRLDLVITNPGHYVGIRERQPLSGVLATVIEQGPGASLATFGGVIFVRSDREGLSELADLAGARIAAVSTSSLGGFQAQAHELLAAGLEVPAGARLVTTGAPHDRVVEAVLSGRADAGFVRSGTLEQMAAEGKLDLRRLSILHRQDLPGFPYAVSTRLYPEWPVVALSHVDEPHVRRIAAALLTMDHAPERPGAGGYHGFTIAADYSPVEQVLRELRLPPFDRAPAFDVVDVLRRYRWPLTGLALAVLAVVVLSAFLAASNRRLDQARRDADLSASTLSLVLSTASVGITKVRDRHQVWASRRMEELFGYTAAEMAGASTRLFYPDDEAYQRLGREGYLALSEGRTYVGELQMRRKDGSLFWARLRGAAAASPGEARESIWTFEDVTERHAAEEGLRQALAANEATLAELREAASRVKLLSGLLPICMYCHKIRADHGYWDRLEVYISSHSEALFSHGICPTCMEQRFPDQR